MNKSALLELASQADALAQSVSFYHTPPETDIYRLAKIISAALRALAKEKGE
jgi:hypothetical protein